MLKVTHMVTRNKLRERLEMDDKITVMRQRQIGGDGLGMF